MNRLDYNQGVLAAVHAIQVEAAHLRETGKDLKRRAQLAIDRELLGGREMKRGAHTTLAEADRLDRLAASITREKQK